jgi:hypothetical protein
MWKALISGMLCLLAACGGGGFSMDAAPQDPVAPVTPISPGGGGAPVSVPDATFNVGITNYDEAEYALWVQWQDAQGAIQEDFLESVPAALPGSFTQVAASWPAVSGTSYELLLMDPSGALVDTASAGIPASRDTISLSYLVVGGVFQLESVTH